MSEKREGSEDAYGPVLQGLHDKAKALLLASQSPAVERHTPCPSVSWRCCQDRGVRLVRAVPFVCQAIETESIPGDAWGADVVLETFSAERNAGSPTGREP
jgi:hypothetical protein